MWLLLMWLSLVRVILLARECVYGRFPLLAHVLSLQVRLKLIT